MSSDSFPQNAAYQQLTAENRGPVVIVASYVFLVITVIVVFTRLTTRFQVSRKFSPDDYLILASTIFLLGQTIAVTVAVNKGLGRHRDALSDPQFDRYAKAFYASRVLAIPTLAFAKSSANCLIIGIRPPKTVMRACQVTLVLINVWALAAVLAVIFECSPPHLWAYQDQCVNQWALYLSNVAWNIVTDLALIVLPFFLMQNVQVSSQKRWVVIGLFGSRIIVPAFTIAAAYYTTGYWAASPPDPTWHAVNASLWTQAVINLSIITACIPCIKRFLADLSTGMMTVNISEPLEMTMKTSISGSSPVTSNRSRGLLGSRIISAMKSKSQMNKSANSTMVTAEKSTGPQLVPPSQSKRTARVEGSESPTTVSDGIIVHTIDYEVNYEQGSDEAPLNAQFNKTKESVEGIHGSLDADRITKAQ